MFESPGVPSKLPGDATLGGVGAVVGRSLRVILNGGKAVGKRFETAVEAVRRRGHAIDVQITCPYHKLNPDVRMVEATEVRYGFDPAFPQNWPCQWRIFAQR